MSKRKEYITADDLIDMLSDIKKEELERIRRTTSLKKLEEEVIQFCGKLEVFAYQFHFLGFGTVDEINITVEKIMNEIKEETRERIRCQI